MESRKMVQMNLFAGQEWDADIENGHVDTGRGEEGVEWIGRLGLTYIHDHV